MQERVPLAVNMNEWKHVIGPTNQSPKDAKRISTEHRKHLIFMLDISSSNACYMY